MNKILYVKKKCCPIRLAIWLRRTRPNKWSWPFILNPSVDLAGPCHDLQMNEKRRRASSSSAAASPVPWKDRRHRGSDREKWPASPWVRIMVLSELPGLASKTCLSIRRRNLSVSASAINGPSEGEVRVRFAPSPTGNLPSNFPDLCCPSCSS